MNRLDWITGIKNSDPQCRHHISNAGGLEECGSEQHYQTNPLYYGGLTGGTQKAHHTM